MPRSAGRPVWWQGSSPSRWAPGRPGRKKDAVRASDGDGDLTPLDVEAETLPGPAPADPEPAAPTVPAPAAPSAPSAASKPRRPLGRMRWIATGVAVSLVAGVMALVTITASGGASGPEDAVRQLVSALHDHDALGAVDVLAPE